MKQSVVLLVVAIFGLLLPVLVEQKTVSHRVAEWRSSQTSALSKDPEVQRGEDRDARRAETTTPDVEEQASLPAMPPGSRAEENDGSYLVETAGVSATLTRQGPATAIARLNPTFVARLAGAIREARQSGLPSAGIFSAYRPPAFGVGRFLDRFNSLHAYGLAVDMTGIGGPGSDQAKLWHDIAGRHGIFCPYGPDSQTEWNHCQATPIRMVCPDNPLRNTITAEGPIDLAEMFKVGNAVIDNPPATTCVTVAASRPEDLDPIGLHVGPHVEPHAARTASTATSAHLDRKPVREARNVATGTFARARQHEKARMLMMVAADLRLGQKTHAKAPAVAKPAVAKLREPRKAARAPEGHHVSTHHRSHLV
jgi:hypothetical protein